MSVGPGGLEGLVATFNVFPFAVWCVVFSHHARAWSSWNLLQRARRAWALSASLGAVILVASFIHVAVWTSKSSTASIAFVFIPIWGSVALVVGYLSGFMAGMMRRVSNEG